jgi:cell division protein FtsI/penicillin-binding protein 2
MVTIRKLALAVSLVFAFSASSSRSQTQPEGTQNPSSLFAQSASRVLNREFTNPDISFLLLDAHTGAVIAARWENPETPIPLGSLVKPFTALAYGEQHAYKYPIHICRGKASGCWFPRGHGNVDLTAAIAYSCNSYFRALTQNLTGADVSSIATRFDLQLPGPDISGPALAGLGTQWKISPLKMARAYLELVRRRDQPGVPQILDGMAQSARQGTGTEVDRALTYPDAMVKTGTAACTHRILHTSGDGFTVAIAPAVQPQVLLLVRVHGVPGSHAARIAGQMLYRIEE